jgi:heat shock protein HtpX
MGGILVVLGFLIGSLADPELGGIFGAIAALAVWLLLMGVALLGGDQALLLGAGARPIRKQDMPRLWNVVEEMTIASGLGQMPKIYIINDPTPNAFAAGPRPDKAVVAVTSGLLKRLNRDELQGVIAHEIGHIKNLDVRFMTLAAVMVGSITIIADLFLRSLWFGAGGRRSSKVDPRVQLAILAVTVIAAILAPICARLLYMACSRQREYLADASAARFTRYPEGLASALEKIALAVKPSKTVNRALAPLYIVNPLQARASGGLFSTHPDTELRIKILRSMGGGAGYVDYENAYRSAHGEDEQCLGKATLESEGSVQARGPSVEKDPRADALSRAKNVDSLLGRLASLLLIPCVCGVQIQVPPKLKKDTIPCPRCGRKHDVPRARRGDGQGKDSERVLRFERTPGEWESFECPCGKVLQLSPAFVGNRVDCPKCDRAFEIATKAEEAGARK